MLFRMTRLLLIAVLLALTANCSAQQPCDKQQQAKAVAAALHLRQQMRAIRVSDDLMGESIPKAIPFLPKFKAALVRATETVVTCHDSSAPASDIQAELSHVLHARQTRLPDGFATIGETHTNIYGKNLLIAVTKPSPNLLAVKISFDVECGDDNIWLVFEAKDARWLERILWQSPPAGREVRFFGDFFLTAILTTDVPGSWRAVVVHGSPWCTSRFSGFDIDVLEPTANARQPRVVWHTDRGYSRGSFEPTLKASGNIFELRLNDDAMHFDIDIAFERRVIYRYRVNANTVDRIEPIALNARGFVEEWLDMPWNEAAAQIADPTSVALKTVHDLYEQKSTAKEEDHTFTKPSYGPVLGCQQSKQFQVELAASLETFIPNKPGSTSTPLPSTYFKVRETANGYEVLSATNKPDPQCSGPNLMNDKR